MIPGIILPGYDTVIMWMLKKVKLVDMFYRYLVQYHYYRKYVQSDPSKSMWSRHTGQICLPSCCSIQANMHERCMLLAML
jgi:hypothetical protein